MEDNKHIDDLKLSKLNTVMISKHKTDIMREMLFTKTLINFDEISLHSSDGEDIISSTDKKLSEIEERVNNQLSSSSISLTKSKDGDNYFQSRVKNEYKETKTIATISVENIEEPSSILKGIVKTNKSSKPLDDIKKMVSIG